MNATALKTTISYESKLVKRNWLFYLFVLGVVGYMVGVLIPWNVRYFEWSQVAFASSVPLRGIHFLNLFQSLIVAFLVCDIQRKRWKAETREVLSVRPIGNGESFLGEVLGVLVPFFVVDIVFMIACLVINVVIPDTPVNLWVNFYYLLTRVLPALFFVTGLSLLVNGLIKLPAVCWLILSGFLYFAYSYLVSPLHGILDFRGSWQTDTYSTIVGLGRVGEYLLQRGVFLLLGVSILCFAAPLTRRLPGRPGQTPRFIIPGGVFLVLALSLGYIYVEKFQIRSDNRSAYRAAFAEYVEYPTVRVSTHDITYRPEENRFSATSRMKIENRQKEGMERFLLFLNPGLEVGRLDVNGEKVSFRRDCQVIVVEHPLAAGEQVELVMEYGGGIDEDIYQVNVADEEYFAPVVYTSYHENYGKRSAFLSADFTLLVPEVMWYPVAVSPMGLNAAREVNFTRYTLHVETPGDEMTVLSQGEATRTGDDMTFENVQDLPGLSLCMGEFQRRSVTIDSVMVELYTYPGNDFYMKSFDEWKVLKQPNKLQKVSGRCKELVEGDQLNPYPFKYFRLVEVPSSFLRGFRFENHAQPEIVFFEERFATTDHEKPGVLPRGRSKNSGVPEYLLAEGIPRKLDAIKVDRVFSGFLRSVTSDRYRGMDLLYKQMQNPAASSNFHVPPERFNYIVENGLGGCITGEYSIEQNIAINLKVSYLLGYLTTITTWDSLNRFMEEFSARNLFREVDFDLFLDEFEQRFGQGIWAYVDDWYASRELPYLSIKDVSLKMGEETKVLDFKVGNFSATDGIVSVVSSYRGDRRLVIGDRRSYIIKPGEMKRIVVHGDRRYDMELNTNFSGNLPQVVPVLNKQSLSPEELPDEGVTVLERAQFYPPGEIIVDNVDENFRLIASESNQKRLADLVQGEEEEEEYFFLGCNVKANTWGGALFANGLYDPYGECVRSAYTKRAGTGNFKAEWVADLPEAGRYEIFAYRPHIELFDGENGTCVTDYPGMKNYYTVYTPEGSEELILGVERGDPLWVSLGTFSLPEGKSRVVLDDRGVTPIEGEYGAKYVQLVVADAVKWVKAK